MKSVMKKIGWFVVSLLPVLAFSAIQLGCAVVVMLVLTVIIMLNTPVEMSAGAMELLVMEQYYENIVPILIVSQIAAVLVFGLWYYFAWGKKKRPEGTEKPAAVKILLIVLLGVLAQFAISGLLSLVQIAAPEALQEYEELMELAGITEFTALTLISTVLLAPLSEELVCRGVIFRLAGKISPNFWVANIVQALAFGILHGNLVQGAYAFVLGLLLGMVYRQFKNIWLCMLLHASMNFSSVLVEPFYSLFPDTISEGGAAAVLAVTMVVAAALGALCVRGIVKKRKI
ncbi:MAG: CPBP family intramembrane metalloprotease [Butyrivibrio sp.]|nr:CPBP family intramembrane metalloprotease [Acetatifactor muris]MCM1558800.1 CPBP family intramembrane metalloprotease [Butyrivibrio sp.]